MSIRSLIVFIVLSAVSTLAQARQSTGVFKGYPVIAHADTLFHIKNKLGSLSAAERAERTSSKHQLNSYISNPEKMPAIYSEIHKNIHLAFDEAGLEIMSPHYQAIRDGNGSTVPGTVITKEN